MVVNMFTAEHAENTESQDNHLGSSYNSALTLDSPRVSDNDDFQRDKRKKVESFKYCRA
jgi:hypothetical protein